MKSNVAQPVRNLLDHAGPDYCKAVEIIHGKRESCIWRLTKPEMTNEEMHCIRGEIAMLNDVLATLGWEEAREKLR